MTIVNEPDTGIIMVAGSPASSAFGNLRSLANDLVGHFAANVIPCGLLPREELQGDVTNVTMGCLRLAMDMLDKRRVPTEEDLVGFRDASAQWAREGIPLQTVLEVLHEGFRLGWRQVVSGAQEYDMAHLADGAELLISMLDKITQAATSAYIAELKVVASEHHTAAHTLVTALLSGQSTSAMARHCGIEVASSYVVLALHLDQHTDELHPGVQPAVAARRKLRRVQAELAKAYGRSALSLLSPEGGTVLIPDANEDCNVDSVIEKLTASAEVTVTASAVRADTEDVPQASEQAHELLDLARQLHRAPGVYRMSDLVYEYQMMRPGVGRSHLVHLLQPLEKYPDLVKTLDVHVHNDLNRQRTARQLHVHTNTVDYRLKRIAELTGLDPTRASGLRPLQAALLARRLEFRDNNSSKA
ncbi:MAG: PucR family transcriptional regulator [Rhodococcus sp.]|nr:PucR family transcriptional regulator [Rhodococcus sp. (in: high G+C Gram-positive bacteria)]